MTSRLHPIVVQPLVSGMKELGWKEAAIVILKESNAPMHYSEITDKIIDQGLRTKQGATPDASLGTAITESINREGESSPFVRIDKGIYQLRDKSIVTGMTSTIEAALEDTNGELIGAFGMYWERSYVSWSGVRLLGQQRQGSTEVDFTSQLGVYLLHDRRDVVYVGRSTDQSIGNRLKEHNRNRLSGRWDRFSWFGILPVKEDGTLGNADPKLFTANRLVEMMEALLIEALEPPLNRKRGDNFEQFEYLQVRDPDIENAHILKKLTGMLK